MITSQNISLEKNQNVIAIIPAYNEAKNIAKIITESSKYVSMIIVVDDGSRDNTRGVASSLTTHVIYNRRNLGKGAALRKGLIESLKYDPDIIVTIDADGQHDPSEIPKLLQPIKDNEADIVIGSRYMINSISEAPALRRFGLSIINRMNRSLFKTTIRDSQSGFRAYNKAVLSFLIRYDSVGYGVEVEQLAAAQSYNFQMVEVPITVRYKGLENTSKKNYVLHGMNILSTIFRIAIERKPLLFFGVAGIIFVLAALVTSSYIMLYFNETRYFSLPLALITIGFALVGSLLMLISFVFYALKRIREREDIIARSILELFREERPRSI
jgi:glycosyltransferase involved in cell wall biosynthesis